LETLFKAIFDTSKRIQWDTTVQSLTTFYTEGSCLFQNPTTTKAKFIRRTATPSYLMGLVSPRDIVSMVVMEKLDADTWVSAAGSITHEGLLNRTFPVSAGIIRGRAYNGNGIVLRRLADDCTEVCYVINPNLSSSYLPSFVFRSLLVDAQLAFFRTLSKYLGDEILKANATTHNIDQIQQASRLSLPTRAVRILPQNN
jgi:hypothetical protein